MAVHRIQIRHGLREVGLRHNPFNPRRYDTLNLRFVDRAFAVETTLSRLEDVVQSGGLGIVVIKGEKGFGKTAFLRRVEYLVNNGVLDSFHEDIAKLKENIADSRRKLDEMLIIKPDIETLRTNIETRSALSDSLSILRDRGLKALRVARKKGIDTSVLNLILAKIELDSATISPSNLERLEKMIQEDKKNKQYPSDALYSGFVSVLNEEMREVDSKISTVEKDLERNQAWQETKKESCQEDLEQIASYYQYKADNLTYYLTFDKANLEDLGRIARRQKMLPLTVGVDLYDKDLKDERTLIKKLAREIVGAIVEREPAKDKNILGKFLEKLKLSFAKNDALQLYETNVSRILRETSTKTGWKVSIPNVIACFAEEQKKEQVDIEDSYERAFRTLMETVGDYFEAIVFFFDDAYHIRGQDKHDIRLILLSLVSRPMPTILLFAVPWTDDLGYSYSGIAERAYTVDLHEREMFSVNDFMDMIRKNLESARIHGWKPVSPMNPFTEKALEVISDATMKVPLYVEYVCRESLESIRDPAHATLIITGPVAEENAIRGWKCIFESELTPSEKAVLLYLKDRTEGTAEAISKFIHRSKQNVSHTLSTMKRKYLLISYDIQAKRGAPSTMYKIRIPQITNMVEKHYKS